MLKQEMSSQPLAAAMPQTRSWVFGLTSFFFALLQSACSAVLAISGLRLLIGIGSLAAAGPFTYLLERIHGDWLRLPMTVIALTGTLVNLYVIWRIRTLRARPASSWRMPPLDSRTKRTESLQLWISFLTLLLLGLEWIAHIHLFGKLLG